MSDANLEAVKGPSATTPKLLLEKNAMYIIYCGVFTSKMFQGIFGTYSGQ